LDKIGLFNRIFDAVIDIYHGRIGLDTDGGEHEGRISFRRGLSGATEAFTEAHVIQDLEVLILAEYTFLGQELQFCDPTETQAIASLVQAIQSFDDALLALEMVQDKSTYIPVEKSYPHQDKYRVHNMPKDAFHIACIAHRTRLQNILRSPGINLTEKALYQQRFANMAAMQSVYLEKQRTILA
jgi:hypothetical protein